MPQLDTLDSTVLLIVVATIAAVIAAFVATLVMVVRALKRRSVR